MTYLDGSQGIERVIEPREHELADWAFHRSWSDLRRWDDELMGRESTLAQQNLSNIRSKR